jgi:hypothetical protein
MGGWVRAALVVTAVAGCDLRPLDLGGQGEADAGEADAGVVDGETVHLRIVDGRTFSGAAPLAGAHVRLEASASAFEAIAGDGGIALLENVALGEGELVDLTVVLADETLVLSLLGLDVRGSSASEPLMIPVGGLARCIACERSYFAGTIEGRESAGTLMVTSAPEVVEAYPSASWAVSPPSRIDVREVTSIEIVDGVVRAIGATELPGSVITLTPVDEPASLALELARPEVDAFAPVRAMVVRPGASGGFEAVLGYRELFGPGPFVETLSYAPEERVMVLLELASTFRGTRSWTPLTETPTLSDPPADFDPIEPIQLGVTPLAVPHVSWGHIQALVISSSRSQWLVARPGGTAPLVVPRLPSTVPLDHIVPEGELARVGVAAARFSQAPPIPWHVIDPRSIWDDVRQSAWNLAGDAEITE